MTRNQKLAKLGNAIREYRGRYVEGTAVWTRPPQPSAIERVTYWLVELDLDVSGSIKKIDNFKNFDEFNAWISKL